jgi:cytochrome c-type biogenesis protein CcmH/NrfF
MLIYHCPTTSKVVRSDIETSEAELRRLSSLKLSLWCPYCQVGHAILGKDAQVSADAVRSAA